MPRRRVAPVWLGRLVVDAIHADQVREHGGLPGVRDENALESALARPQQKHAYDPGIDLAGLAAAYAFGLARNHPYRDGNKRIAFLALVTFLGINGRDFDATEEDVVATILALADGRLTEAQLARWVRDRLSPRPSRVQTRTLRPELRETPPHALATSESARLPEGPAQQHDLPGVVEVVLGEPDELRERGIRRIRDERIVEVRGRKRRDGLAHAPVERERTMRPPLPGVLRRLRSAPANPPPATTACRRRRDAAARGDIPPPCAGPAPGCCGRRRSDARTHPRRSRPRAPRARTGRAPHRPRRCAAAGRRVVRWSWSCGLIVRGQREV